MGALEEVELQIGDVSASLPGRERPPGRLQAATPPWPGSGAWGPRTRRARPTRLGLRM